MSVCARCGATFSCAMADGDGSQPCWCASLPPVVPVPVPVQAQDGASATATKAAAIAPAPATDMSCWCPDCLRRHIAGATQPE
ncbi:MAG TPA: cysteine-rich CWC family protein [Burkholderiaceae bacterium]|jgi:hypothetical protein|nr:cysteine-rich CWC family protein [Burkholderiaceae bacterium]